LNDLEKSEAQRVERTINERANKSRRDLENK
jgi:hypothetical protein